MTVARCLTYLALASTASLLSACAGAGPSAQPTVVTTTTPAAAPTTPAKPGKLTPVTERAALLKEAAQNLEKAQVALDGGNKNLAEQLFSFAELIVGPDALASIASNFREGAPPRVTTPPVKVDEKAPPQPKAVGNSEADDEAAKVPPPKVEGSLTGTMTIDSKAVSGAFGLITLEPANGKWKPRTPKRVVLEQRNREFLPHLVAVSVGTTISFPNFDGVFHNVFSSSPLSAFDLGLYKMGEAREYRFEKEGILRIGCNLHANMSAYIAVVSAPAYVVTDDKGNFAFKHLPPGTYKLKAWSERSKAPITQDLTIKAGANTVTVGVTGDAPTGNQPDKFGGKRG
ncbi:MAG: carboxypeptidase regulatory-like domain-containing protein [Proteobacteria bacterium]|nr:carboxypeptidase regulatory-like domain-containing protein [Pseudomonadota bacterium]